METPVETQFRLAELLGALSLATDLSQNLPFESALRSAMVAVGIARHHGLSASESSDAYYLALLNHLGCTGSAPLEAAIAGDDNDMRATFTAADYADLAQIATLTLTRLATDAGPATRLRTAIKFVSGGRPMMAQMYESMCEAALGLAKNLSIANDVRAALPQVYLRWDGKIFPPPSGEGIALAARIVQIAHVVEFYRRTAGDDVAIATIQQRAGGQFDPTLARTFVANAGELLGPLHVESVWDLALAAEPLPHQLIRKHQLVGAAGAFAAFVDLKTLFMLGHSTRVAELAVGAAKQLGLDDETSEAIHFAGLLHDIGRVSVPNGIWQKPGPLNNSERERVRLHPYYSDRVLAHSEVLRPYGWIASSHHERLDGSGYHRGLNRKQLSTPARILACADVYQALISERPHRPAMTPDRAAYVLREEVEIGQLDQEAASATLHAAGQARSEEHATWPQGLTDREVEVLRELARGGTNREIASRLFITGATVHTHVLNIYGKIGVRTRAGAALFATEHDLIH